MTATVSTHSPGPTSPLALAALIQIGVWLAIEAVSLIVTIPIGVAVLAAGASSALLSAAAHLPRWWSLIGFLLPPAAALALYQPVNPLWYLAAFLLMLSVYRGAPRERVPLYLSGRRVLAAIESSLPVARGARVIDLGAGIGSTLAYLSGRRPDLAFTGVENAPLPYLIARLRLARRANVTVHYRSFWKENLAHYDFVYAYLSPAPMAGLWRKAATEMQAGAWFASYRFVVPDVPPTRVVQLHRNKPDGLYLWQR